MRGMQTVCTAGEGAGLLCRSEIGNPQSKRPHIQGHLQMTQGKGKIGAPATEAARDPLGLEHRLLLNLLIAGL